MKFWRLEHSDSNPDPNLNHYLLYLVESGKLAKLAGKNLFGHICDTLWLVTRHGVFLTGRWRWAAAAAEPQSSHRASGFWWWWQWYKDKGCPICRWPASQASAISSRVWAWWPKRTRGGWSSWSWTWWASQLCKAVSEFDPNFGPQTHYGQYLGRDSAVHCLLAGPLHQSWCFGDTLEASNISGAICLQLHGWGHQGWKTALSHLEQEHQISSVGVLGWFRDWARSCWDNPPEELEPEEVQDWWRGPLQGVAWRKCKCCSHCWCRNFKRFFLDTSCPLGSSSFRGRVHWAVGWGLPMLRLGPRQGKELPIQRMPGIA